MPEDNPGLVKLVLHYDDGTSEEVVIPPPSNDVNHNQSLVFWGNAKDGVKSVGGAAINFVGGFLRSKPELLEPVIEHATGGPVVIRRVEPRVEGWMQ